MGGWDVEFHVFQQGRCALCENAGVFGEKYALKGDKIPLPVFAGTNVDGITECFLKEKVCV